MDQRIRERAFFLYENDRGRTAAHELDDWLAAEDVELALAFAEAAQTLVRRRGPTRASFDQDDVWYAADSIGAMLKILGPRLRNRRKNSVLLRMIESYQDYLTSSTALTDAEAVRQGTHALHIYRLTTSLDVLLAGGTVQAVNHSLAKELKDLFSENGVAFETSEFNTFSAAALQRASGLPVVFIGEGDDLSPDLQVDALAYVECKDLHPASRSGLAQALDDHLDKATKQLNTAQKRQALPGTGVCIDVPWGMLPLAPNEWQAVRDALTSPSGPTFVLVSCSGATNTPTEVGFPVVVSLVTKATVPQDLHDRLLKFLTNASYRLGPTDFLRVPH